MRYAVAVIDTESASSKLVASFSGVGQKPRSVYVVGLDEASEFALALQGGEAEPFIIREETSQVMLQFTYSEAIGTEDFAGATLDSLLADARRRVDELQWRLDRTSNAPRVIRGQHVRK